MRKKKTSYRSKRKFNKKRKPQKIRPGADSSLKPIFASIGVPEKRDFIPDTFQLEAVSVAEKSDCLVTAPTGAGKTWIARQRILEYLKRGQKVWYASPLKALSNAKYLEFLKVFGEKNVGILTGDRKENSEASVIIGTTEILRNQLYDAMYVGENLDTDFVVLDEAHYMGDEERGVVWEEIMIYLPTRIPLLLLSATIGNADDIASWLSVVRGRTCVVVKERKRPVPLYPLFLHPKGTLYPLINKREKDRPAKLYHGVKKYLSHRSPYFPLSAGQLPPFGQILNVLKKYHLLPTIFFLKSRADCDNALKVLENDSSYYSKREWVSTRFFELARQNTHLVNHRHSKYLLNLSVGAHHSGQLPGWKLMLESLMTEGLLDAVFATSTVAAGVNFPARSIVFFHSDRFNGKEFLPLTPTEFHQMTGRAGRRGMDKIGFAIAVPGKFMDLRLCTQLINSPSSDVTSKIKINFSMVLNLLLSNSPEQVSGLLKKSFTTYSSPRECHLSRSSCENKFKQLWEKFLHHFHFLIDQGYAREKGSLTVDGVWASRLRVDHPLMIAESLRYGFLSETDPIILAALMGSLVSDGETDEYLKQRKSPRKLLKAFNRLQKGLLPFIKTLDKKKFDINPILFKPARAIYDWASGEPWEKVIHTAEIAEGDLVMLIFRTADHLRHIGKVNDAFPSVAKTANKSRALILREPVVIDYGDFYN